jgi:hypothetical protein
MLKSVEGRYHDGRIELLETPEGIDEARVIVTFLPAGKIDLSERGINESQAADLRAKLRTIAEDGDAPEMEAYDAL